MNDCPCCGMGENEYTCDVCGESMCVDCLREDMHETEGKIQYCEDCYNSGKYDEYIEKLEESD